MHMGIPLRRSALWYPEKTAVICGKNKITYKELNSRTNRLANALASLGVKKGDRVALLSPNRHQFMEGAQACFKQGFVKVPLNARLSIPELVEMLNNSGSKALVMSEEFVDSIDEARNQIQTVKHYISMSKTLPSMLDYETLLSQSDPSEPDTDVSPDDIASLSYTSGTTGILKAAMLSHRNRICQARKMLLMPDADIDENSVMCHVAPITHGSSTMVLPIIWRGGCTILHKSFDVAELLDTIETEKVTHLLMVPTMLNMMLMHPDIRNRDLSTIKTIVYTAAPMPVQRIKEAIDVFGPVLIQMYALTETAAGVIWLSKKDHILDDDPKKIKRLASAGLPHIECEIRIVDNDGNDVKKGEVGEIIERGDDTMMGYWEAPELTAKMLTKDGWVHTKDMAREDEDGYIYIVDRKFDMIISGGFNIYPSEVENVLYRHPDVYEAAVIGIPDDVWGESIKAFVVLKEDRTACSEELIDHCKRHLASYKKPKSIELVVELPKNTYGKILRRDLREKYWAGRERNV